MGQSVSQSISLAFIWGDMPVVDLARDSTVNKKTITMARDRKTWPCGLSSFLYSLSLFYLRRGAGFTPRKIAPANAAADKCRENRIADCCTAGNVPFIRLSRPKISIVASRTTQSLWTVQVRLVDPRNSLNGPFFFSMSVIADFHECKSACSLGTSEYKWSIFFHLDVYSNRSKG